MVVRTMWAQLASAILGVWLMAAPDILGYGPPAATSDRIAGPIAVSIGIIATSGVTRPLRWVNLLVGLWLVIGPWLLGFPTLATINSVVVGVLLIGLAFVRGTVTDRYGGGWSTLLPGHEVPEPTEDQRAA